jgi:hypothetical protein
VARAKGPQFVLEEWDVARRAVVRKSVLDLPDGYELLFEQQLLSSVSANLLVVEARRTDPAEPVLKFFDMTTWKEVAAPGK